MNKLKGFTMAEMVVTMAILGVVAVMVLPVLNNSRPNEEMVMVKKSYHNTARIIAELINDDELYPEYDSKGKQSGFANFDKVTYNGKQYSTATKFCGLFAAKVNAVSVDCSAEKALSAGGNFKTTDGVVWSMPFGDFAGYEYITIDTNGTKNNNCSINNDEWRTYGRGLAKCKSTKAPDQFIFRIDKFGSLLAAGAITREYISSNKISRSYKDTKNYCAVDGNCK